MVTPPPLPIAFKVLTVNVHKGFTTFNRRFMLHELRAGAKVLGFNYDTGERYLSVEGFLPA